MSRRLARRGSIAASHAQTVTSSVLPENVAGVYWPHWETVRLNQLPVHYNTVILAFAVAHSSQNGSVVWAGLNTLNQSEFQSDIQELRADGVCCLLSIGGEGITFSLSGDVNYTGAQKVANFVSSVQSIYTAWGGFDGIDWDIEGQPIDVTNYAAASRQLRSIYGSDFSICMAPAPSNYQYKDLAQDLQSTGDLGMISPQYYDYDALDPPGVDTQREAGVVSRTNELVGAPYNIDPHHIGIGTRYVNVDNPHLAWRTIGGVVTMWNNMKASRPTIRGAFVWDSKLDRDAPGNGQWATQVAPLINPDGRDGGGGGGGSGKISTLTDNFATFDTGKWTVAGAAAVQNGRIELPRTWNFSENARTTVSTWDLTESSIYCQFTHPTTGHDSSGPVWSNFEVRVGGTTANRFFYFIETTGAGVSTIIAQSQEVGVSGGAIVNRWTATYNTTNHAWLRIREASGTVYWDTSNNGASWTQQASLVRTANPTACQVYFSAAFNGGVGGTQGITLVDNVNS